MIFCTSICGNYLPKAAVLATSLKKNNPKAKFICCLLEKDVKPFKEFEQYFDEIVLAKNLEIEDFNNFIFRHRIVEASTAVKPSLLKYLMKNFNEEKFIYLDPDIRVYGEFTLLEEKLDRKPIVLTPHLTNICSSFDSILVNEINGSYRYGIYNLGFIALKKCDEGLKLLDWWEERLNIACYSDILNKGIFTDQKWMDLAPAYFDVEILKDNGYNVAPWNLSERKVYESNNILKVNDTNLTFFHFSGLDSGANTKMLEKYGNELVIFLQQEYIKETYKFGQKEFSNSKWSYDYYIDGKKIEDKERLLLRFFNNKFDNPFTKGIELEDTSILNLLLSKDDTYIWGCGKRGKDTFEFLNGFTEIHGWIDSNENMHGSKLSGLQIYPIREINVDSNIIIASSYEHEIVPALVEKGFTKLYSSPISNKHYLIPDK